MKKYMIWHFLVYDLAYACFMQHGVGVPEQHLIGSFWRTDHEAL
jgi:hypothetical protein